MPQAGQKTNAAGVDLILERDQAYPARYRDRVPMLPYRNSRPRCCDQQFRRNVFGFRLSGADNAGRRTS